MIKSVNRLQTLPNEVQLKIIGELGVEDKKTFSQLDRISRKNADDYLTRFRIKTHRDLEGLLQASQYRNIQSVDMTGNGLTDQIFHQHFSSDHGFKELTLKKNPISNFALFTLSRQKSVNKIDVSETLVTGAGLVHLEKLPELRSLNLSYNHLLGEMGAVLPRFAHLEELDLSYTNASVSSLQAAASIASLKKFNISNNSEFNKTVSIALSSHQSLEELRVSDVDLKYKCLLSILQIPGLKTLDMSFNPEVNSGNMAVIAGHKTLEDLDVRYCGLSGQDIEAIAQLETLKKLSCSVIDLNHNAIDALARHPLLEEFTLDYFAPLSPAKLEAIAAIPGLKHLSFTGEEGMTYGPDELEPLSHNTCLSELHIENATIPEEGILMLCKIAGLKTLTLNGNKIRIDNKGVNAILRHPQLTSLIIQGVDFSVDSSFSVPENSQLENLTSVYENNHKENDYLQIFAGLNNLKSIDIRDETASERNLIKLLNHNQKLESVSLWRMQAGEELMKALARQPKLRKLLICCETMGNDNIELLSSSSSIEELSINHTSVDNDCLPWLAKMEKLTEVNMMGTGIHIDSTNIDSVLHSSLHSIKMYNDQLDTLAGVVLSQKGFWVQQAFIHDDDSEIIGSEMDLSDIDETDSDQSDTEMT